MDTDLGGTGREESRNVAETSGGGILAAGNSGSEEGDAEFGRGGTDA
ncbi:MAG: hypothetical protein LBT40_05225 [Deltaproteobacteria bacterium]|nr:hypothetical protein [Deltaproteobacteria bacterium]